MDAQVVEVLECPICCELFETACETFCGHCFCEHCLNACLEFDPNTCPVCRANPTPIHPSFTVRRIVEEYRKFRGLTKEKISPRSAKEEKDLGNQCYSNNKYADAIEHYNKALEEQPTAALFGNRAICYYKLKQYRLAIMDCDRGIQLEPQNAKLRVRKALCLEKLKEFEEAKKIFQEARKYDVNNNFADEITSGLQRISQPSFSTPPPSPKPTQHQSSSQPQTPNYHNYAHNTNTNQRVENFFQQQFAQPFGFPPQQQQYYANNVNNNNQPPSSQYPGAQRPASAPSTSPSTGSSSSRRRERRKRDSNDCVVQ